MSKITCCGKLSRGHLTVTWNHPFLFTAALSTAVELAVWVLPKNVTSRWDKQLLGDKVVTNIANILEADKTWQYVIPGLSIGPATLCITCKASRMLIIPDEHNCFSALEAYAAKLYHVGRQLKNVPFVSTLIEMELAKLDLCPLGHTNHTSILNSLAIALSIHFDQEGNVTDLNRAIEIEQGRLDLCPLGHPEHVEALSELALSLARHYDVQKNKEDLNRLMEMQQRWLDLCPLGHSDHARALSALATSFWNYYLLDEDMSNLKRAIQMGEDLLNICPAGSPYHDTALYNLAQCLTAYYEESGDPADLDRSISLQEKHLELCPPNHQDHGIALQGLATSFWHRYIKIEDLLDLTKAIKLFKEALNTYPVQHLYYAYNIAQIAATNLLLFNSSPSSHPPDQQSPLDEAFEAYRLLKKCSPAVSLDLWKATQAWVQNAEEYNHPSVLEAYHTSLDTLNHFTSLNPSLDARHEAMQAKVADLANNAFSCAIRHGDFSMAVELLEQGRGILWNQLACFDTSIVELESQGNFGCELGRRFRQLSADLKKHTEQSEGQSTNPYWRVQSEWNSVVDSIRRLDGFSRFLLPPRFDDLQQSAEYGPVIVVNASEYGCDALILVRAHTPIRVPLRCSLHDVVQLCSQLSELTRDSHAYGTNRELYVKELLRDLWSCVVERIVTILRNDVQLPPGSHIWWCPTSKFTTLPLHAAGPYRKGKENLMDIYVSSYAPSLSALLRARNRVHSQGVSHNASQTGNMISFAAVGQAHPSADINLSQLPEVEHEIKRIHDETNMPSEVKFECVTGATASIEGAVQAFRDHRWVHVACHGAQHAKKPFESWFAMGDGKLTLMRIIQERYTNSDFAFLSACHTAVGDASTPDEVLHLAAGMQFAGFNGVIGTLWRVDDSVAHQMVTRFYQEIFKYPVVDSKNAAAALNTAAVETAGEVTLEKRIVFVHIGV